jgi:hypothetical protein
VERIVLAEARVEERVPLVRDGNAWFGLKAQDKKSDQGKDEKHEKRDAVWFVFVFMDLELDAHLF